MSSGESGVAPEPLSAVSDALRAELELWRAKAALESGALDEAWRRLLAIGHARTELDDALREQLAKTCLRLVDALAAPSLTAEDDHERAQRSEALLHLAATAAPRQSLSALATHCERLGRHLEAVRYWQEAIRLEPRASTHYLRLADLQARMDQPQQAWTTYLALLDAAPTASSYLLLAQRLDALAPRIFEPQQHREVRIALLGNATLHQLAQYVRVECYRAGLWPQIYEGGFDQYTQEILDERSGLYEFAPEVLVCAVHASRLFPRLHAYPFDLTADERRNEMASGLRSVADLLAVFRQRSNATVLLHNMVGPQQPALGILDWREELGHTELFAQINAGLARLAREQFKNVYIVDEDRIQARTGKARATEPRHWLHARLPWSGEMLRALGQEYLRFIRPMKGLARKCVVLDLDNTLWGGVIGEDGVEGIQIGHDAPGNAFREFQRALRDLSNRGILLAICSKNNEPDAIQAIEEHPDMLLRLSSFAAYQINWEAKSENIRRIATQLNIGLDSLVFLDDNPIERAEVTAALPDVLVPELPRDPSMLREFLLGLGVFDTLSLTEDDRNRNRMYAQELARKRHEARVGAGLSLDEYLAGIGMVLEVQPASSQSLPRIAQLTSKTNQFNLSTIRYSEADVEQLLRDGGLVYSARLSDRFGDSGIVGVGMLRPGAQEDWLLDTLLLSCRAMGRGVETALLACLVDIARQQGATALRGWYRPTAKNAPARDFFEKHGFTLRETRPDGAQLWELASHETVPSIPGWLTVQAPALAHA